MTAQTRIHGLEAYTQVVVIGARAYAQGRLDASRPGDRWVSVHEFAEQAVTDGCFGTRALQRLYARMLIEGTYVYGGGL